MALRRPTRRRGRAVHDATRQPIAREQGTGLTSYPPHVAQNGNGTGTGGVHIVMARRPLHVLALPVLAVVVLIGCVTGTAPEHSGRCRPRVAPIPPTPQQRRPTPPLRASRRSPRLMSVDLSPDEANSSVRSTGQSPGAGPPARLLRLGVVWRRATLDDPAPRRRGLVRPAPRARRPRREQVLVERRLQRQPRAPNRRSLSRDNNSTDPGGSRRRLPVRTPKPTSGRPCSWGSTFPTAGCWRITATYRNASLSLVAWVSG